MKKFTILFVAVLPIILYACTNPVKKDSTNNENDEPNDNFKIVGYLPPWRFDKKDSIKFEKLTHLNLAFANPDSTGKIVFRDNEDIKPIIKKGHDANIKVLISLAGAVGGRIYKEDWKREMHPDNRKKLVDKIVHYVEDNDLDGVDVDIEKNLQSIDIIGENYNVFVLELREALHSKGKIITTALNPIEVHPCVSQEALEAYDFINVMAYDKHGWWGPEDTIKAHHSPYSYAEDAYNYWAEELNIPEERLVLGMPFYGRDFDSRSYIPYFDILRRDKSLAYTDSVDNLFFNGIPTIVKKTQLAKEKFGGVMFWNLGEDVFNDLSLFRAAYQTLEAGDCKVSIFFKDRDGDGYGDPIHPYCACEAPEGYVSNRNIIYDTIEAVH